jgi:hypothetical protein
VSRWPTTTERHGDCCHFLSLWYVSMELFIILFPYLHKRAPASTIRIPRTVQATKLSDWVTRLLDAIELHHFASDTCLFRFDFLVQASISDNIDHHTTLGRPLESAAV